jgi:hypothetical protein
LGTETSQLAVDYLKMSYHMLYIISSWRSKHGLNKNKNCKSDYICFLPFLLSFALLHYIVSEVRLLTILFIHQRI